MDPIALKELFTAPPSEFTKRRDELSAEAIRSGDPAGAQQIKKLRKPTVGAWSANLLAHERPDEIEKLLQLGATLRNAQLDFSATDTRALLQQRRVVIDLLVKEARALAHQHGQEIADQSITELESTLNAALAGDEAGQELQRGQLAKTLTSTGLESFTVDLPALPMRSLPSKSKTSGAKFAPKDELKERRLEKAKRTLASAQVAVREAQRRFDETNEALARVRAELADKRESLKRLEDQVRDTRSDVIKSEGAVRSAESATERAEREAQRAQEKLEKAEEEVEQN